MGMAVEAAAAAAQGSNNARSAELVRLMQRTQTGCPRAFAQLVRLARPQLLRQVQRINRNTDEADEILQEVLVIAWSRCASFDAQRGSTMGWLLAIARHQAVSSLRQRGRGVVQRSDSAAHGGQPDPGDTDFCDTLPSADQQPPERLAQRRAADAVHASLATLGQTQRDCIQLAYFDGLSHAQIAQRLGKPLGTVKSWLRRALHSMRPAMAGH